MSVLLTVWCGINAVLVVIALVLTHRAAYHKGRADAFTECAEDLRKMVNGRG